MLTWYADRTSSGVRVTASSLIKYACWRAVKRRFQMLVLPQPGGPTTIVHAWEVTSASSKSMVSIVACSDRHDSGPPVTM